MLTVSAAKSLFKILSRPQILWLTLGKPLLGQPWCPPPLPLASLYYFPVCSLVLTFKALHVFAPVHPAPRVSYYISACDLSFSPFIILCLLSSTYLLGCLPKCHLFLTPLPIPFQCTCPIKPLTQADFPSGPEHINWFQCMIFAITLLSIFFPSLC